MDSSDAIFLAGREGSLPLVDESIGAGQRRTATTKVRSLVARSTKWLDERVKKNPNPGKKILPKDTPRKDSEDASSFGHLSRHSFIPNRFAF
jgi:hypothetical protein